MSHPFLREGDPLQSQGEGVYQFVTGTKRRGDRDESPFLRRGWGVSYFFLGEADLLRPHGEGL